MHNNTKASESRKGNAKHFLNSITFCHIPLLDFYSLKLYFVDCESCTVFFCFACLAAEDSYFLRHKFRSERKPKLHSTSKFVMLLICF